MGKYKNVEAFGPSKESAQKFLLLVCIILLAKITGDIAYGLIHHLNEGEPIFNLAQYVIFGIIYTIVTLSYFIARWLAYRTKAFPKIENREGLHFMAFIILSILLITLSIVLMSI